MKFKIFGWTVLIQKDPPIISNREDNEIVSMIGDTPYITQCGKICADTAWRAVKQEFFNSQMNNRDIVDSKIPMIKMFREQYRNLRGITPSLITSKNYVDERVDYIDSMTCRSYYVLNNKGRA